MTIFNGLGTGGIIVIVLVVIIIIIVAWYIAVLNNMRKMNIKIDEADSNIDVALTKRYDLLTKLFQATKGYMNHEKETLEKVVAMRQPKGNADIHDKEAFANEVGRGLQAINVVVEQYPDLKASQNIIELQRATTDVEENLQASRRVYNSNVSVYNQYIVVFPNSIVAGSKYGKREFFEIEDFKRQDVSFDF